MIEHEFEKEKMDSIKALADTNVKIGEARGVLENLKKDEVVYLEEREKKAIEVVDKVLADSKEILEEATKNYQGVKDLLNSASSFADFLKEAYISFSSLVAKFSEKSAIWEEEVTRQQKEIADIKQQISNDQVRIKNDQEALQRKEASLVDEKRKIDDQRATLERAINRLREGRI
jgi:uncharacterized protein involved in exopolysaccharide biosynthesis